MNKVFVSKMPAQQLDALQAMVTKHIVDPSLRDIVGTADFTATSTERGLLRWEQAHLVAALDVLNAYQRDRRSRSSCRVGSLRLGKSKEFAKDPRTRIIELLKRWLRTHAGNTNVSEEEVRGVCGLCRDILNHPALFPARNPRSFLQSVAEVYDHLQLQLREVLERDRTCAELAQRVLSLSRNLISDAVGFLLLAPSDFRQTDTLPSLEVVALWQSLPDLGHPLPGRADAQLQRTMRDAWGSDCGGVVAAVLSTPCCVRLFDGARGEEEASKAIEARAASSRAIALGAASSRSIALEDDGLAPAPEVSTVRGLVRAVSLRTPERGRSDEGESVSSSFVAHDVSALIAEAVARFERGSFRSSGLAGAFRDPKDAAQAKVRQSYFEAAKGIHDLIYLLAEVLVQFHRISDGMGDYGMIRMSPWLHPFLDALMDKLNCLKGSLEHINEAVESAYVLARARQGRVEKPAPSDRMCSRAHACIERAVTGRSSHAKALGQAIEELKARSAPERLPMVTGSLGDACKTLQVILQSPEFRDSVGDAFANLPPLGDAAGGAGQTQPRASTGLLQLADGVDSDTDVEPRSAELEDEPRIVELGEESVAMKMSPSFECHSERSTAPSSRESQSTVGSVTQAEVWNCTASRVGRRLKRRDQRVIVVHDGCLHIYEKGGARVEAVMDPVLDMSSCAVRLCMLSLAARRLPEGASWEDGVFEHAEYSFEFDSADFAATFYSELKSIAG